MTDIGTDPACCVTCKRALDETARLVPESDAGRHWYAEAAKLAAALVEARAALVDWEHRCNSLRSDAADRNTCARERDDAREELDKVRKDRDHLHARLAEATPEGAENARLRAELRDALEGRQRDRDEHAATVDRYAEMGVEAIAECDAVTADLVWRWCDYAARFGHVAPCPRCWGPMLRSETACVDCARDAELLGSVAMR